MHVVEISLAGGSSQNYWYIDFVYLKRYFITVTSYWARWRLKSPVPRLFAQPFVQEQIKEHLKAPRHWPLSGNSSVTGQFPTQKANNAENVSFWWRHHVLFQFGHNILCDTSPSRGAKWPLSPSSTMTVELAMIVKFLWLISLKSSFNYI